jgi:transcriptional regulator of acetoin/glycerol metabolism
MAGHLVSPGEAAGETADQKALARSRILFLTSHTLESGAVRTPILASWRRSRDMRVAANQVNPILEVNPDLDTFLSRAAGPVLNGLLSVMSGQPVSIVLTDRHGLVLTRLTGDNSLERRLDAVGLAPGFNYAENSVGTNGIGTALEVGAPTHVFGHEHYAERLEDLACAGVPIKHPLTGRTVGVVDLTCWRRDAGTLLLALAKTTAQQVQTALLNASGIHERELLDEYLRICRRSSGIVLAVNAEVGMLNEHARTVLSAAEQSSLLTHGSEALSTGRLGTHEVDLPGGGTARMHMHAVGDPTRPSGLVVRVVRQAIRVPAQRLSAAGGPRLLPGLVGTVPVWTHACQEVEQHFLSREWLAVVGERGVGKLALLQAVQLRRQPVPHVAVLDAAVGDDPSWTSLLRQTVTRGAESVVLHHVDRLGPARLRATCAVLQECRSEDSPTHPWVVVTLNNPADRTDLSELLRLFPGTVYVPPLRLHAEDIPALVAHFTRRSGEGAPLVWSSEALQILTRSAWPGNIEQLHHVVRWVMARRRAGVVEPEHLPPEVRSVSRRALNTMESLERDAIVEALRDCGGDKELAAASLGMSRATIYRRIRAYGIVDTPS